MGLRRPATTLALISVLMGSPAIAGGPYPGGAGAARLTFHANRSDPAFGSIDLLNLSSEAIANLRSAPRSADRWRASLRIIVEGAAPADEDIPAVLGGYEIMADRVRFTPRFPPEPGVRYRAIVDLSALLATPAPDLPSLSFSVARSVKTSAAHVVETYPSPDILPANLLRIYVVFSEPMREGYAQDQVTLLDPSGRPDTAAFFKSPVELWDPSMRRLTVLFDPGRIKREVGPNRELGAPLRQGSRYTLVIGNGMVDADGRPLDATYSKTFAVSAALRTAINPHQWSVRRPGAGARGALTVTSPVSLDWALMARDVQLIAPDGAIVAGRVTIDRHEHRWSIRPSRPWSAGVYNLQVDGGLEDVSGNTIGGPFDVEAAGAELPHAAGMVSLPVKIGAGLSGRLR